MTFLPDIDQDTYDAWSSDEARRKMDERINSFTAQHAMEQRIASLTPTSSDSLTNPLGAAAPAPEAPQPSDALTNPIGMGNAPAPEPPAAQAPTPQPVELPAPAAPPTLDFGSRPTSAPELQVPSAAAPTPSSSSSFSDWFGQTLGSVAQAGGDVAKFASSVSLSGGDLVGSVLGAAAQSGADVAKLAPTLAPPPAPAAAAGVSSPSAGAAVGPPVDRGGDLHAYARQAAQRYGVDPNIFEAQIQQESGFRTDRNSPAGATGIAQFMPETARGMGVNPNDPYDALDGAARLMSNHLQQYDGDYSKALAAYNAGPGNVAKYNGVPPFKETQTYVSNILGNAKNAVGSAVGGAVEGVKSAARGVADQISQFGNPQLTNDEAYAACGPAAAVRFASMYGRNPTLREATDLASQVGWTSGQGMAGLGSEKALMDKLGVPTKMVSGAQWDQFAQEAQTGNPVTISTAGHYFFADGYDPTSGAFHVGRSGTDLKGGSEWMTPAQMTARMGAVQGGLLADNPQVPAPSNADRETNPSSFLDRTRQALGDSFSAAKDAAAAPLTDVYGKLTSAATGIGDSLTQFATDPTMPLPSDRQPTSSDSLTNPLRTGNAATSGPLTLQSLADRAGSALPDLTPQMKTPDPGTPLARILSGEPIGSMSPGDQLQALQQWNQGYTQTREKGIEAINPLRDVPLVGGLINQLTDPEQLAILGLTGPAGRGAEALAGGGVRGTIANNAVQGALANAGNTAVQGGSPEEIAKSAAEGAAFGGGIAGAGAAAGPIASRALGALDIVRPPTEAFATTRRVGESMEEYRARSRGYETPRVGASMLQDVIGDLQRYPEWASAGIRDFIATAKGDPSEVASTVRAWMQENPQELLPEAPPHPASTAGVTGELDTSLRTGGGSTGGGMPSRSQPEQMPLGAQPEEARGYQPRMPVGEGEGGVPSVQPEAPGPTLDQQRLIAEQKAINARRAAAGLEPYPMEDIPTSRYGGNEQKPLDLQGDEYTHQTEMPPPGEGPFEPPNVPPDRPTVPLKLPGYVPQLVGGLLQDANRMVDHAVPISDKVLESLASRTGETVDRIRKVWKPGEQGDAALRSISRALDTSAEDLARAQEVLKLDPSSEAARADVVRGLARHQSLQETAGARRPVAGSMLEDMRADKPVSGPKSANEQLAAMAKRAKMTPDEYAQQLSKIDMRDPDVVASMARVAHNFTFGDKLAALYYFNLLTAPLTHIRNIVGNAAVAATRPGESLLAAGFDPLARKLLGDTGPRQRYIGEVPHQIFGMGAALKDNQAWLDALKYGVSEHSEAADFGRMSKEPFAGKGLLDTIGWSGRGLEAEDLVFKGINGKATLYGEAYRLAKQKGLKGAALEEETARLMHAPTVEMLDNAKKEAAYRTFQQRDNASSKINAAIEAMPGTKGVVPFVRTPLNISKYMLERTPLGAGKILADYMRPGGRAALKEAGAGDLADRMARTTMGSAMMYGAYKYAEAGNLTGRPPSTPEERDQWEREGKTPYSFRNPVTGDWVSYAALQPFAGMLGAAADVQQAVADGTLKEKDAGAIGTAAAFAAARGLLNQQWTQGAVELLDLLQNGSPDPSKDLGRIATKYTADVVPGASLWRSVARMTDNTIRDANVNFTPEGIARGVAANLPGASQLLPADVDAFGYPRVRPTARRSDEPVWTNALSELLNPLPGSKVIEDPVDIELKRLEKATQGLPSSLGGYTVEPGFVGKDVSLLGGKLPVRLDDDEQRKYQEQSGRLSYAMLSAEIGTKEWDAKSDAEKAKRVSEIYSKARQVARAAEEPGLLQSAAEQLDKQASRAKAAITRPAATPAAGG